MYFAQPGDASDVLCSIIVALMTDQQPHLLSPRAQPRLGITAAPSTQVERHWRMKRANIASRDAILASSQAGQLLPLHRLWCSLSFWVAPGKWQLPPPHAFASQPVSASVGLRHLRPCLKRLRPIRLRSPSPSLRGGIRIIRLAASRAALTCDGVHDRVVSEGQDESGNGDASCTTAC